MPVLIIMFVYTIVPFFVIANHFFSFLIAAAIGIVLGIGSIFLIGKKPLIVGAVQLIVVCIGAYFIIIDGYGLIFKIIYFVCCLPLVISNVKGFLQMND